MERISQEHSTSPAEKLAVEAIAAEQLQDTLRATEVADLSAIAFLSAVALAKAEATAEEDFDEERAALMRAQRKSEAPLKKALLTKEGRVRVKLTEEMRARIKSKQETQKAPTTETKNVGPEEISNIKHSAFVNEHLHLLSSQEQKDLSTQSFTYWAKRLLPEIDILPSDVADSVRYVLSKPPSFEYVIALDPYIHRRQKILKFNVSKRAEMNTLKKRLKDIDARIDYSEEEKVGRRTVFYDAEEKSIFVDEGGEKKPLTYGDIVADIDWGVSYRPDESCPKEIWRKIRKLSDVTEIRKNISHIFNQELASLEGVKLPTTDMSLESIERHMHDDKGIHGVIGERIAKNILMRMSYNNPEVGFKVESVNAIEDAELKYDFKVYVPQKTRGVALEGEDMPREEFVKHKKRIGIQFTASSNTFEVERKEYAVATARQKVNEERFNHYIKRKVDDIVLVSVPFLAYKNSFKQWLERGKPSGGPEQFLSVEEKNELINKVLASL